MAEDRTDASTTTDAGPDGRPPTCVVGIGTVGLQRAVAFDAAGHEVVGFDVADAPVEACRRGDDPTGTVGASRVADADCLFTTEPAAISHAEYVFVSVPTRLDDRGRPALDAVVTAGETVGANVDPGTTVVLESTVPPGTTAETFVPAVASASGMRPGEGFDVAYSPERRSPEIGCDPERTRTRLVAAPDPAVAQAVASLYERIGENAHIVPDVRTAEAAKCVENVHRDVNVALVNDLAGSLGAMGLDPHAVLDAAATKWNVPRYRPGPVGGECLPTDPHLLDHRATRAGSPVDLVRVARAVNDRVPRRLVETTLAAFADRRDALERGARGPSGDATGAVARTGLAHDGDGDGDSDGDGDGNDDDVIGGGDDPGPPRVVLLGLAYKRESPTVQGAPSVEVARRLSALGVDVVGFDPHVDCDRAADALDVPVRKTLSLTDAEGLVVLVGHRAFDPLSLGALVPEMRPRPVVVDVPGVFDPDADVPTVYRGVGDVL